MERLSKVVSVVNQLAVSRGPSRVIPGAANPGVSYAVNRGNNGEDYEVGYGRFEGDMMMQSCEF